MIAHLKIGRLIVSGLPAGHSAETLRRDVATALSGMLDADMVARLAQEPRRLTSIALPLLPPGQPAAPAIAAAIRDKLFETEVPR